MQSSGNLEFLFDSFLICAFYFFQLFFLLKKALIFSNFHFPKKKMIAKKMKLKE